MRWPWLALCILVGWLLLNILLLIAWSRLPWLDDEWIYVGDDDAPDFEKGWANRG